MTSAAAVALLLALPFAVGDWWSRLPAGGDRRRRVELVCKPATLALLLVAAATLDPAAGAGDRQAWFVAALAFSLAGDVLLMLPDRFVPGLVAFLVAHVCYIAGLWTDPPVGTALALAAAVVVVVLVPLAVRIVRAVRAGPEPALAGPVAAYIAVISAMVASALASGYPAAAVGASLFAGSDSLIAWDRFVRSRPWVPVAIMVTYHLGQLFLVLSLLD